MAEKLTMKTANLAQDHIAKIREIFPNCVTETRTPDGSIILKIDFEALKQELGDSALTGAQERYQMTWPDKAKSKVLANSAISATLRPYKEESVSFDTTQNLYIEGDNLDVLKLLRETYLGKVKIIYIDPPYNTGNDFVYQDFFAQSQEEYLANSGQYDEQGNRLVQNAESNGKFHTDWLNMIYPRLRVARDLLSEDGIMFISIGEQEVDNLKKIVVEIFGADNFIENYIWESTFRPDNSSAIMRRNAEYVMCVAKNIKNIKKLIGEIKEKEGLPSLTKSSMKESVLRFPPMTVIAYLPDGVYKKGIRDSYELLDDVTVQNGIIVNAFSLRGHMIWGQENLENEIRQGTQIIIKGEGFVPYTKKPGDSIMSPTKIIPNNLVGDILSSNAEHLALFDKKVFSYPKPTTLLKYLIKYLDDKGCVVMDFFSGSATTADAVMQLNAADGGNRKFIMVQLPENLDENLKKAATGHAREIIQNAIALCDELHVPHLLTEVAKERIRRAAKKTHEDTGADIDYGFRVLKLDSSNMQDVYYNPSAITQSILEQTIDNVKPDRTPLDLLFQVMLELGVELSAQVVEKEIKGKKYYTVNGNDIIACFDDDIDNEVITEIAKQKPIYAVFKDKSFATDSVGINNEQLFKTYSPSTEIKVV